jgi:4-hydroxy-tetrahydrodipicolinate reductase
MNIAQIGAGNMGRIVATLAGEKGHTIATTIDSAEAGLDASKLAEKLKGADIVIDFSTAKAVRRNVEACMVARLPVVEGTTGWENRREEVEKIVKEHKGALVYGANFSIGVNLFYRVTEFTAELFSKFPEYEVFIEEQHHSRKKDAPSGTALKLKELIGKRIAKDLSVSSTRAGNIPGTHRVGFDGPADQVLLEHIARTRAGFAAGALLAAEWIAGKSGFFEFGDVITELVQEL